jgi:hypothetical protein
MPSSKYHREQAQVLAGLALSTNDPKEVVRFTQAAMEHLERAQAIEAAGEGSPALQDECPRAVPPGNKSTMTACQTLARSP